jgi:hypothetical protein
MPKSKRKPLRAQQAAVAISSTQNVKPWVKWVALAIVAALGISVIAGALTATPAHASTRALLSETATNPAPEATDEPTLYSVEDPATDPTLDPDPAATEEPMLLSVDDPSPGTCLLDTDNDGIANPDDADIDGDGIINGEDEDIDGDGIVNSEDGDPASTNCYDSKPPVMAYSTAIAPDDSGAWGIYVTFGIGFAVVAVVVITLVSKRKKKD